MKNKIIIALLALICVGFATCKKKQPTMKTGLEGCDCAKEVSADFLVEQVGGQISGNLAGYNSDTDSSYTGNIKFTALEENAEYTWYIGNEVIHDRTFFRNIGNAYIGQNLVFKLIVSKIENKICLPNVDGIDSAVRTLQVLPNLCSLFQPWPECPPPPLIGTFRLKEKNSLDSVDVSFTARTMIELPNAPFDHLEIINLSGNNDVARYSANYGTYRKLWLSRGTQDQATWFAKRNKVCEFWFKQLDGYDVLIQEKFYAGRKLY